MGQMPRPPDPFPLQRSADILLMFGRVISAVSAKLRAQAGKPGR